MYEKVTIKYNGELREYNLAELDLANPGNPTDTELKASLCLALGASNLSEYAVDKVAGGTIINVRPAATYA